MVSMLISLCCRLYLCLSSKNSILSFLYKLCICLSLSSRSSRYFRSRRNRLCWNRLYYLSFCYWSFSSRSWSYTRCIFSRSNSSLCCLFSSLCSSSFISLSLCFLFSSFNYCRVLLFINLS